MDWSMIVVWVAFLISLAWGNRWKSRAIRERDAHKQCHANFDAVIEGIQDSTGIQVMYVNPEAVKNNGSDN